MRRAPCVAASRAGRRRKRAGFTLVESVITSIVSGVVVLVLYELHATSSDVMHTINAQGILQMELARAADTLSRDTRLTVATPSSYGAYTAPPDLILQVPSVDASGHVIDAANDWDYIVYHHDAAASTLERVVDANEGAGSARTDETHHLGTHITGFTATLGDLDVSFTITAEHTEGGRTFIQPVSGRARFRNAPN